MCFGGGAQQSSCQGFVSGRAARAPPNFSGANGPEIREVRASNPNTSLEFEGRLSMGFI